MDIEQLAGTRLGNYEIEPLLGRDGMGVVYQSRQISVNNPVALKILPPDLSTDSFVYQTVSAGGSRRRKEQRADKTDIPLIQWLITIVLTLELEGG